MKHAKRYFTLIELLTVTGIIAVLAGITVGVVSLVSAKNAEAKTTATIKALELALAQFKADNGRVYVPCGYNITTPSPKCLTVPTLASLGSNPDLSKTLLKYLDEKLLRSATKPYDNNNLYFVDAWNRPLIYRIPGKFNKTGFDLGSAGPDGKVGDGGALIPVGEKPPPITDNEYAKFGQGDDIVNFLRKD